MDNVINALLNCLLVSIPEEIVWVTLTLVLLKRFDLLDWRRWKRNIKLLSIPIFPVSISISILRYIFIIPKPIMSIFTLIMLITLIYYIVKKTDKIDDTKIYKVIMFTLIGSLTIIIIESLYIPITLYLTGLNISDVNNSLTNNFLLSLPIRLLQFGIILYIIYSKNYGVKFNKFLEIFKNKFTAISLIVLLSIVIVSRVFFSKVFNNEGFYINMSVDSKLLLGTSLTVLPTIFFMFMIIINIYYTHRTIQIEQKYSNMLDEVEEDG